MKADWWLMKPKKYWLTALKNTHLGFKKMFFVLNDDHADG